MVDPLQVATPEGVVPDAPEDYLDNGAAQGQDAEDLARRAARRHSGWVPSSSNGDEVTTIWVRGKNGNRQ